MKGQLHHVELYVSDLERSRAFWGWLLEWLGYVPFQAWPEGFSWRLGATYLVFVQAAPRFLGIPYHRCRAGLNHLAFHAESPEQVDVLAALLRARQVPILYEDRHPHAGGGDTHAVFFEDPDRIKVEFTAARLDPAELGGAGALAD